MTSKNRDNAERMKAWYEGRTIPETITTGRHETIENTKRLIGTALGTMEYSEANSLNFRAAYMRLYFLKQHIETLK